MKVRKNKGFTLVELLVVIAVIGLLSSMAFISLNQARQKARDALRLNDINNIHKALIFYETEHDRYPSSVNCGGTQGADTCSSDSASSPWIKGMSDYYIEIMPDDPQPTNRYFYQSFIPEDSNCGGLGEKQCIHDVAIYQKDVDGESGADLPPTSYVLCYYLETNMNPMSNSVQIFNHHNLYCTGEW